MTAGFPLLFLVAGFIVLFPAVTAAEQESAGQGTGCLGCHSRIESINDKMAAAWGADERCEICHYGNPAAASEAEAHAGLISNPADLRVIDRTCGRCHSDCGEIQNIEIGGVDNHVGRVLRSIMATAAGEIAGARYLWNAQNTRSALYGVRDVVDLDRAQPPGAVDRLLRLPPASHSEADHLLRSACLRCHLWTEDKTTSGTFRSSGCSACHVLYAQSGLSRSADTSIPKNEPGHPIKHEITTAIPTAQCLTCHNDGGARIGMSYIGLSVTHSTLERQEPLPGDDNTYGAFTINVPPDVHFRRGMDCIDCHDTIDMHGDGNIYSHQEFQVTIRCETCHGTADKPPSFRTEQGRRLSRVAIERGKPYLLTKIFMEKKDIPVISAKSEFSWLPSIWHQGHKQLECYTCHSSGAPQCYACHLVRDDRKISVDWAQGIGEKQPAQQIQGAWSGRKFLQQWFDPALGINYRGRVSPFIPGGQSVVSRIDMEGGYQTLKKTFTTAGGLYGFSMNPVQPHTTSSAARDCGSCHSSSKALGLGTEGLIDLRRHGLPIDFPPDKMADEDGARVQDCAHEGVRPFSGDELKRIFRTGSCASCHSELVERASSPEAPASLKEADEMHKRLIELLVAPEKK